MFSAEYPIYSALPSLPVTERAARPGTGDGSLREQEAVIPRSPHRQSENYMHEGTGSPVSSETVQAASEAPRQASRWLASAGVLAAGAGPLAAGLQGNRAVAVISAAPGLLLGLLVFFGVVCPAIWSKKAQRQRAALNVLNALIGRSPGATRASR
jgi:hypothetical protein